MCTTLAAVSGVFRPQLPAAAAWLLPGVAALYLLASVGVSCSVAWRQGLRAALPLPAVFATMHLAWGAGFWVGILFPPRLAPGDRVRREMP